ncbi:nuclear transport factor 2 family protein [Sphingomonas naphthae]|uniref:Nuclear transport factor 2 family protein n=1 Tax=Sphingomonas naphthae TaxID=1813468 RepID=A0ABY7TIS4_9SPHN|nr:nuclear transport factor 2 family protein [Sphingomonas naphthae]WCT73039.1 nuclear transport factor 2 family protein [Sphingomonas naphthae]
MSPALRIERDAAIGALLIRYATAIDRRDWAMLATCFTAGLEADYGAFGRWIDREALVSHMARGHDAFGQTLHRITNIVIGGGADAATSRCYVDAILMPRAPGGAVRHACGWYDDDLVRTDEGWRIDRRRFVAVWVREQAG